MQLFKLDYIIRMMTVHLESLKVPVEPDQVKTIMYESEIGMFRTWMGGKQGLITMQQLKETIKNNSGRIYFSAGSPITIQEQDDEAKNHKLN